MMMLFSIKKYKQKKQESDRKKGGTQFIKMFAAVSKELNLYGSTPERLNGMLALMGRAETSTDMFIKTVIIVHSTGGLGLYTLQRLASENIEEFNAFELGLVRDLLTSAFVFVSEVFEEAADNSVSEEPFNLYASIRWYISREYKSRERPTYHDRLGKDYDLEQNLDISIAEFQP